MVPDTPPLLRKVTFVLMAIAYLAVEVASDVSGRLSPFGIIFGVCCFALAILVSRFLRGPSEGCVAAPERRKTKAGLLLPASWSRHTAYQLALASLLVAPLLLEPILRAWTSSGQPLEMQMVNGLRVLGVGLAAFAVWPLCLRLAGVVSLFLMLFVSAMGNQTMIPWLLGAYGVVGSLWLMLAYSSRMQQTAKGVADAESQAELLDRQRLRFPWWEVALLGVLVLAALSLVVIQPRRVDFALMELMPTSGGTSELDLFARFGIGDGPEETAGDNARTAGMVDSDKLIEDNKNSLIDAVNDTYGPPQKPPRERERMVAAGLADLIKFHGKLPDNRRPSRDFDTSRKGPKSNRKLSSRKARGVFEVEGRTPLHIRLVAYGKYDPVAARWIEGRKPRRKVIEPDGWDWMRLEHLRDVANWYRADDRHRLKVADLKSNLVPTPTMLTRFRIRRVNRPEYYDWDYDGVLVLAGRKTTPPGVVVHTDCRTVAPHRLPPSSFGQAGTPWGGNPTLGEVPVPLRPEIEHIARTWVGDQPRGWPQVNAILTRLRTEYTLDRTASAPEDHPAPVLWFLTQSRRGPDYLFATAAVLLLRSLEYPARVCLGYYANPDAYDPETEHTPVRISDLHTWPEVLLRDGHWLVIEPTPGYEVLGPRLPFKERVWLTLLALGQWAWQNASVLSLSLLTVVLVVRKRRFLLDGFLFWLWWLFPGRSWREVVFGCLRLIERRCRWQRLGRPPGQTLASWVTFLQRGTPEDQHLAELARLGEWAAYASELPVPFSFEECRAICRRTLETWTLARLRRMAREGEQS